MGRTEHAQKHTAYQCHPLWTNKIPGYLSWGGVQVERADSEGERGGLTCGQVGGAHVRTAAGGGRKH